MTETETETESMRENMRGTKTAQSDRGKERERVYKEMKSLKSRRENSSFSRFPTENKKKILTDSISNNL